MINSSLPGKMNTKHILIEILPRAMWVLEIAVLYFAYRLTNRSIALHSNTINLTIGILLSALGIVLLLWTFKSLAKAMVTKEFITSGLYKTIRHPMYSAIYILLIGLGLLYFSGLWFIILLLFTPIWYLIALAEESQMADLYPNEYPEHKKQAGMFWPRI